MFAETRLNQLQKLQGETNELGRAHTSQTKSRSYSLCPIGLTVVPIRIDPCG